MTRVAVALGSNLGDRLGHLRNAVARLGELGQVLRVSSLYETAPVGGPEQDWYLNAVAVLDTHLQPLDLLGELQRIENEEHRVRRERWGPRTLDLDIVAWDASPVSLPTLVVPHPRAHERRFVLDPLVEVWAEARVAGDITAVDAAPLVSAQRVRRWEGEWLVELPHHGRAAAWWVVAQVVFFVVWGVVLVATFVTPVGAIRWALGGGLASLGVALGAGAVIALGRELTPYPQPRAGAQLVARGPYRWARHPIYGAIVLMFLGVSVVFGSVPGAAVTAGIAVFFRFKSVAEERALAIGIPGYGEYRHEVRRRFVPLVW